MLKYKDYIGSFFFDENSNIFHGKVSNISYPITFQGKSLKSTEEAFKDAIDEYIEWCEKYGKTPEKPSSIEQ